MPNCNFFPSKNYEQFSITNTGASHHEVQDSQPLHCQLAVKQLQEIHRIEIKMLDILGQIDL